MGDSRMENGDWRLGFGVWSLDFGFCPLHCLNPEPRQHRDGEGERKDPAEGGMGLFEHRQRVHERIERRAKDAAEGEEGEEGEEGDGVGREA